MTERTVWTVPVRGQSGMAFHVVRDCPRLSKARRVRERLERFARQSGRLPCGYCGGGL